LYDDDLVQSKQVKIIKSKVRDEKNVPTIH